MVIPQKAVHWNFIFCTNIRFSEHAFVCINYEGTSKILLRISRDQNWDKKTYMLKRSFMHAQFKFDKHVQKCPVKPKTTLLLLPIHDVRMRFCAKPVKMHGWNRDWEEKLQSEKKFGIAMGIVGRFYPENKIYQKNCRILFKFGFGLLFLLRWKDNDVCCLYFSEQAWRILMSNNHSMDLL